MDSKIESPKNPDGRPYRLSDMPRLYEQYVDHHAEAALGSDTSDHNGDLTKFFAYCVCVECWFVIAMICRGHAYIEAQSAMAATHYDPIRTHSLKFLKRCDD